MTVTNEGIRSDTVWTRRAERQFTKICKRRGFGKIAQTVIHKCIESWVSKQGFDEVDVGLVRRYLRTYDEEK